MSTVFDSQTEPIVGSDMLFEVVDGEIVEKQVGAYEIWIAQDIYDRLSPYVREKQLGRAVHEMIFDFAVVRRQRRPDLAFVSFERWPKGKVVPSTPAWEVVPDLAGEVVSPTHTMEEVVAKVREYFAAGVRLVWVVLPEVEKVYIYDSPDSIRVVNRTGELTGDPVIPGFRLPLAELFADESEADDATTA